MPRIKCVKNEGDFELVPLSAELLRDWRGNLSLRLRFDSKNIRIEGGIAYLGNNMDIEEAEILEGD